jgi:hypothetical protein
VHVRFLPTHWGNDFPSGVILQERATGCITQAWSLKLVGPFFHCHHSEFILVLSGMTMAGRCNQIVAAVIRVHIFTSRFRMGGQNAEHLFMKDPSGLRCPLCARHQS